MSVTPTGIFLSTTPNHLICWVSVGVLNFNTTIKTSTERCPWSRLINWKRIESEETLCPVYLYFVNLRDLLIHQWICLFDPFRPVSTVYWLCQSWSLSLWLFRVEEYGKNYRRSSVRRLVKTMKRDLGTDTDLWKDYVPYILTCDWEWSPGRMWFVSPS